MDNDNNSHDINQHNDISEWERCRKDSRYFITKYLYIVNRHRALQTISFNPVQERYHASKTDFDIILKARKVGITTYKCAEYFHNTIFIPNTITTIIAHNLDTTVEIFDKVKLFHERLPEELRPSTRRSNRRELVFTTSPDGSELNSKYTVGTAGNVEFGRGKDIDNLHLSEYAFYRDPESIKTGAMQSIRTGGKISIESTANGYNDFRSEWEKAKRGDSLFKPHFFPWHDDPEYAVPSSTGIDLPADDMETMHVYGLSREQMEWYALKRRSLGDKVCQEYPMNDAEAFLATNRCVFNTTALRKLALHLEKMPPPKVEDNGRLKIWRPAVPGGRYVAGADCAEGGSNGDYSCCIVIDAETCGQVAELHCRLPAHVFAVKCHDLCMRYNQAHLAVERNNHGHAVLNILRNQLKYPDLYEYRDYDYKGAVRTVLGWETNVKSKHIMIDELARGIAEECLPLRSSDLVTECLSYIFNDKGGMGAETGCHDDRVIAMAIALQARKVRPPSVIPINKRI